MAPLRENPIMTGFELGQFSNLFKMAIWWAALAPLAFALMNTPEAIGVSRIVYNVALCLLSPVGGILIERAHPRTILRGAALARFAIYCLLVPGAWFLFDSTVVTSCAACVTVAFNVGMFFDGCAVALSAILDIDLAGVDVIAGVYNLEVTDEDRNHYNTRQEFFFATCFVVFAPAAAFLGLGFRRAFEESGKSVELNEGGSLVALFFLVFAVATGLQWFFFSKLPDSAPAAAAADAEGDAPKGVNATPQDSANEQLESPGEDERPPFAQQLKSIPKDLWESLLVIWGSKPILFRLIFLGLEIAFEDAAIVVLASQMGIMLPWLGHGDAVIGNIWTSVGVASGKLGGVLASVIMMKCFVPPQAPRGYFFVFLLIAISTAFVAALPLIVWAHENNRLNDNGARAIFLITFFFYFFFSTLPKLGLMCLFQSMVSQIENGPRVFGFVAIVAMTFDAAVVMGLSVIFNHYPLQTALWITSAVYVVHGVLELLVGPLLVLVPLSHAPKAVEGDDTAAGAASAGSSSLAAVRVEEGGGPKPEEAAAARAEDGYYTQQSAVIALPRPSMLLAPNDQQAGSVIAVMSAGKNFAYGSALVRRTSRLQGNADDTRASRGAGSMRRPAGPVGGTASMSMRGGQNEHASLLDPAASPGGYAGSYLRRGTSNLGGR